jgi:hypothetical protein
MLSAIWNDEMTHRSILFARLAGSFTGPPILSPGLIKVRNESVALDGSR